MSALGISSVPAHVEQQILALYDTALPYHNAGHALLVRDRAVTMALDLIAAGHAVDLVVVELAALLHDAGYRAAPETMSREAYAAQLSEQLLTTAGYTRAVAPRVAAAILATEHDASPHTIEESIVRAADLLGMGADEADFTRDCEALRHEAALLSGQARSPRQWAADTVTVLGRYVATDAGLFSELSSMGVRAAESWASRTRHNIATIRRSRASGRE